MSPREVISPLLSRPSYGFAINVPRQRCFSVGVLFLSLSTGYSSFSLRCNVQGSGGFAFLDLVRVTSVKRDSVGIWGLYKHRLLNSGH